MARRLQLAEGFEIPADAVTETFGLLAVRGAGKTNAARVLAEEMFAAGLPFVAVDPVGSWWGLRAGRNGKDSGLAIPVFGGKHGDVPLERGAGQLLADMVVGQRLSCVLDLSAFDSEASKKTFLLDFARRLYQKNEEPLHLFLEEADDYIPQRPMRDEAQLLRAWENIVRRGRARGLGVTLITQRSAAVNKNVLTQVQTLITLRTTGPQDRAAIEDWLKYHAQSREILETLPSLESGEAWVWSPTFLKRTVRVRFRLSRTLDSGETPKLGRGARVAATLADVDLADVRARMAETIARAKAEDPRELRARIAGLEAELRRARAEKPVTERVEVPALKDPQLRALEDLVGRLEKAVTGTQAAAVVVDAQAREIRTAIAAIRTGEPTMKGAGLVPVGAHRVVARPAPVASRRPNAPRLEGVTPAQQRILDALAWLESIGLREADRTQLALLADASPTSSAYANNLGALRSAGLIEYAGPGAVVLTDQGRSGAHVAEIPRSSADVQGAILRRLPPAKARILSTLIELYPRPIPREALAEAAGASPTSSAYANNLGALRSLGVIDYRSGGVVALPVLFLER